jgi:hypothetical protein
VHTALGTPYHKLLKHGVELIGGWYGKGGRESNQGRSTSIVHHTVGNLWRLVILEKRNYESIRNERGLQLTLFEWFDRRNCKN